MASHGGKLWAEQRLGAKAAAEHYGDVKPHGTTSPTMSAVLSKSLPIRSAPLPDRLVHDYRQATNSIPKRKVTWGGVESLPLHA